MKTLRHSREGGNPAFKLFFKLLTVFGMVMVFAITGWAVNVDVSLTKTASVSAGSWVNQGVAMSYTLTISNTDTNNNAKGLIVTDALPSGVQLTSISSADAWVCSPLTGMGVTVTCTLDTLTKNSSSLITLNALAPTSTANGTVQITNSASVATSGPGSTNDPTSTNNTGTFSFYLNRPPVAVNDLVSTASHTAVSGNVLTNDSDLDGNTLTVTNTGTFTLAFGSIAIASNGDYTYTPGYFSGETDSYTYTISDGHGGTATATLTINISSNCSDTGLKNSPPATFCLRKQTVLFGDMATIGNTLIVPPNPQPTGLPSTTTKTAGNGYDPKTYCNSYTNGTFYSDTSGWDNQNLAMCSYRPDGNLNATQAELKLPANSKIKWAGLYLQSVVEQSAVNNLTSMQVKIKNDKDITGYQNAPAPTVVYNGSYVNKNSTDYYNYSAFIDVTNLFTSKNWADGNYTIANVPVTTHVIQGNDQTIGKYGAWVLQVIYENTDPDSNLKSISIYDGWKRITGTGSNGASVTVDNFYTPTSGDINSRVSIFVAEGDKYREGDNLKVGSTTLGTSNNSFDASVGTLFGSRFPLLVNNQGIDIHAYELDKVGSGASGKYHLLTNSQSSITFNLTTGSPDIDYYYPSMLAFSTDVYHPKMCYYEDLYSGGVKLGSGAQVAKGSTIQAKVLLKNDMHETAEKVMLYRTFSSTMPYTSNSTGYKLNPTGATDADKLLDITSHVTDALSSADVFDYSTPLSLFSLHAGTDATHNQGGDFVYNQTALFDYNTTANFEGNTSIVYQIAYTMPTIGFRYEGELAKCVDFNNTFGVIPYVAPIIGNMDVIEHSAYQTAGSYAAADKNILTKVVNKPFDLEAVYLDTSGNEHVYNGAIGNKTVNMAVMLYTTNTGTCSEQRQLIWDGELIHNTSHVDANVTGVTSGTTRSYLLNKAVKDQRIKANFIDYGTLINTATDLTCSSSSLDSSLCLVPACLNSDEQIKKAFPVAQYPYVTTCLYGDGTGTNAPCDSDAYNGSCGGKKSNTIGPIKYNNDIGCAMCLADALGMNGCSTDNFAARPNDFNNTITANQQFIAGQAASITFRADQFGGTGTVDYNETEHSSFVVDVNISDSSKTCAEPAISFSPDINFTNGTVSDNYTLGNVGDFNVTMHEIVGSEYALVDVDDTSDVLRLITPSFKQIKVIPHHFNLDGNLTNGSNGFTYLSNFEQYETNASRNVSAILDMNVSALAADNNITTNYTSTCYAKNGNLTLSLANPINIIPMGALSKIIWYHYSPDHNGSIVFNGTAQYQIPFLSTQFDNNDINGTGQFNYVINFDRNQTMLVNPFNIVINELNATDIDSVDGNKTLSANNNAYYVYGRIIPRDVRVFGNVDFVANAWYEGYNIPTLNGASLAASKIDAMWYVNSVHTDANDGDGNVTVIIPTLTLPTHSSSTAGMETYQFSAIPLTSIPYGGKAHINTDPWLWYGINALNYADPVDSSNLDCLTHPCFNITVVPSIGATGSAKGGAEDKKASKKTDSGGGTWKSTSDYAPAIR